MIEKFLEKFLPQITERVNENAELGQALIETLAVLDNYATINNVQFTDEQVNAMLSIVPEPEPEPVVDIPAQIEEIVEKKKGGRKAKSWTWRFKTEQELIDEFGTNRWRIKTFWNYSGDMDYLFGKPIIESDLSKQFIKDLLEPSVTLDSINTSKILGIDSGSSNDKDWLITEEAITNKPLPTAAAPATQTTWNWRFKTEEEFKEEYGDNWRTDAQWSSYLGMDYLLGEKVAETSNSRDVISLLQKGENYNQINTFRELGISSGDDDDWVLQIRMLTNKPLPKVKLRRGKPLTAPTNTAWTWRIKTEDELIEEYGTDYKQEDWWSEGKDYLLGRPIIQTPESENYIQEYAITNQKIYERDDLKMINTKEVLGINSGDDDDWIVSYEYLTQKPLPNAVTPNTWTWRFKTEQEFVRDYGKNWRAYDDNVEWIGEDGGYANMDFLLGQPISKNPTSVKIIKRFDEEVEIVVDVEKYFGIKNPIISADKEFGIIEQFLTEDPLPTAIPAKSAPKKRGRKPKASSTWNWRFKTEQEFIDENSSVFNWRDMVSGQWSPFMDYLLGQSITENFISKSDIEYLEDYPKGKFLDTADWGVDAEKLGVVNPDNKWSINITMLTQDPLPTAVTPKKSEPKKRGRKPKSELPDIDLGGLEDIGDIDIDDIDFDNLVI